MAPSSLPILSFLLLFSPAITASGAVAAEKLTHLHFYMQEDYIGPNPSAIKVVSGPVSNRVQPRHFGDIAVLNNPLTEGPDPASKHVGRFQGTAARVSYDGLASQISITVLLEDGEHAGSSITVLGRANLKLPVRELPVVGGSGHFRLARGYVFTRSYRYNFTTGGTVEIDMHVIHY